MHWPADHPLLTDTKLAAHRDAADALCASVLPGASVVRLLRFVADRRVVTLLRHGDELVICKVFKSPRARGNHRRVSALRRTDAAGCIPESLGVDETGHAWLVSHLPGDTWDECDSERFVAAAAPIGRILRTLHTSGAELDRSWTIEDELTQLVRRMPPATESLVTAACDRVRQAGLGGGPFVSAHRDCHPKQAVIDPDGRAKWIDLDDAAMAPAGLDVGNVIAHVRRDQLLGVRPPEVCAAAIDGVLAGYGGSPDELELWTELSLLRLAGLATTRHGRPDWTATLCAALAR